MAVTEKKIEVNPVVTPDKILDARRTVNQVYMDEKIERYILDIVFATRNPKAYGLEDLEDLIDFGASPRASINLVLAAKAFAFINRRGYVIPHDIKSIGYDVLSHRVIPSYEAEAEEKSSEDIIKRIFDEIEVP
jgi:MoxR-like ATPase